MPCYVSNKKLKLFIGNKKVKKAYIGNQRVYSAGNVVTYRVDRNVTYTEEVDSDVSCLFPRTFSPTKSGYYFVGWREDGNASNSVLSNKVMGDLPVTLYAVFAKNITVSYDGNGANSGNVGIQSGTVYYNNGNELGATFTVANNGFNRNGYKFYRWSLGNTGGVKYTVGSIITLTSSAVFYAYWVSTAQNNISFNGGVQSFTAPCTGIYKLTAYGAGAGREGYKNDNDSTGGYSTGNVRLTEGQTIYVVIGSQGISGGYNGGGGHKQYPVKKGIGIGCGCTHFATTNRGELKNYNSYRHEVLLVAGGGGGIGMYGSGGKGGGKGGGLEGTNGDRPWQISDEGREAKGGTQTSGGLAGYMNTSGVAFSMGTDGTFGQGGDGDNNGSGGGGGWFGGGGAGAINGQHDGEAGAGGGGGSGYIGGVIAGTGSTSVSTHIGDGTASIQLLSIE